MPAPHRHAPFAAHTIEVNAGAADASLGAGKTEIRCSLPGGGLGPHDGGAPAPCQNDNCPCCPFVPAALGLLPQEAVRAAYLPLLSATVTPPAHLGSLTRSVGFAGQPRAPPIPI